MKMHRYAVLMRLRPDAVFINSQCNPESYESLKASYDGNDFPTEQEFNDEWVVLQTEIAEEQKRKEAIILEKNNSGLSGVTAQQAKNIITSKYDTVRALLIAGDSNAETIANIEAKIDALIDACQWVDIKEAIYLLR